MVCIHMDPVDTEDDRVKALRPSPRASLKIDPSLTLHDFRVVFETHTNMIFDVVVPFDYKKVKELRRPPTKGVANRSPAVHGRQ